MQACSFWALFVRSTGMLCYVGCTTRGFGLCSRHYSAAKYLGIGGRVSGRVKICKRGLENGGPREGDGITGVVPTVDGLSGHDTVVLRTGCSFKALYRRLARDIG